MADDTVTSYLIAFLFSNDPNWERIWGSFKLLYLRLQQCGN